MTRQVRIPGYRDDKAGKVVRDQRRLSVCDRLKQKSRNSSRVRVVKRTVPR